ncbi:MAG: FtsQ-type POTRA domain-containing protein [Proteobacteria bacterium]|nr:FtsQ-type POTRA domain-containing protein [Pseudomonadota bacterium]
MKLYQPKKKKKKPGRKIIALMILAILVFGAFRGCQFTLNSIKDSKVLKITDINVIAPLHIQKAQILSLSGINKGVGIYDVSLSDAKKRIKTHPWVKNVRIRRSLPSTVKIIIQSKEVKALTKVNNTIYYIDDEGTIIDKLIPGFKMNLPVINSKPEEYSTVVGLIDNIKNIDDVKNIEISEVSIEDDTLTIYPSAENIKIKININRLEQCLKNAKRVMDDLKSRGEKASAIDATLPGNRVVVRGIKK